LGPRSGRDLAIHPFFDLNIYRSSRKPQPPAHRLSSAFFAAILVAEFLRQTMGDFFQTKEVFYLAPDAPGWPHPPP